VREGKFTIQIGFCFSDLPSLTVGLLTPVVTIAGAAVSYLVERQKPQILE